MRERKTAYSRARLEHGRGPKGVRKDARLSTGYRSRQHIRPTRLKPHHLAIEIGIIDHVHREQRELIGLAETMRERVRIRGEINTLTAQQRLTGIVIALMPVAVGGMFLVISPDYIKPLFTVPLGRMMLATSAFLEIIGVTVIRRILSIEV